MLKSIRHMFHIRRGLENPKEFIEDLSLAPLQGFLLPGITLFGILTGVFAFLGFNYDLAFLRFLAILFLILCLLLCLVYFRIRRIIKNMLKRK